MANPAEPVIGGLLIEVFFAFMILESVHTGFCMQFIYAYLVAGFGEFENFLNINWGIGVTVVCSAGVALCVQGQVLYMASMDCGKSVLWATIIGFFSLLRVGDRSTLEGFGIASAVLSYVYPEWIAFRGTRTSLITISGGLGSAALVDMLVALTLSFYLKRGRHIWHKESNSMINQILLYAVNTGAITGCVAFIGLVLVFHVRLILFAPQIRIATFAVKKTSLVFLGLVMIQTKLYANSLLGSLNARSHMRNKGSRPTYTTSTSSGGFRFTTPHVPVVEVFQQTTVHDDRDLTEDGDFHLKSLQLKSGELA
ncbi:hypothetical protein C8Q78DRAFT_1081709 [Trametes maxima]|nr:hypothetical protein C8Q78DRAFT_1081709 [Trametes maxima]